MTTILLFYIGCCLGSFSYCFSLDWVNQDIHLLRRSHCDHCRVKLMSIDLIPICSQIFSRFRCRYCSKPTSVTYLIAELLSGLLFLCTLLVFSDTHILFCILFSTTILLMIFCDIHAMLVPDLLQVILLVICSYYLFISPYLAYGQIFLALCTLFSLIFLSLLRPGSLGGADVKLLSILSLCIPIPDFPQFLFFSSATALVYLVFMGVYKKNLEKPIPFIPFIFAGFFISLLT